MSPKFKPLDKVGITGSSWLGPFLVKRWARARDVYLYALSPVKDGNEPVWDISETALYRWPDVGGNPSWDKEGI